MPRSGFFSASPRPPRPPARISSALGAKASLQRALGWLLPLLLGVARPCPPSLVTPWGLKLGVRASRILRGQWLDQLSWMMQPAFTEPVSVPWGGC